jgi:hypothetical protein
MAANICEAFALASQLMIACETQVVELMVDVSD